MQPKDNELFHLVNVYVKNNILIKFYNPKSLGTSKINKTMVIGRELNNEELKYIRSLKLEVVVEKNNRYEYKNLTNDLINTYHNRVPVNHRTL